jgi:hypothetical protein
MLPRGSMRIAATCLILAAMAAILAEKCGDLGLPPSWCPIIALAGWSLGLLTMVSLWAAQSRHPLAQEGRGR